MSVSIASLVEAELAKITDATVFASVRPLLVTPYPVERDWDYGPDKYICWTVLEHKRSNTGIAYCESGFGPAYPCGLVFLSGDQMSIGPDHAWYLSLEDAFRNSEAWDRPNPPDYEVD